MMGNCSKHVKKRVHSLKLVGSSERLGGKAEQLGRKDKGEEKGEGGKFFRKRKKKKESNSEMSKKKTFLLGSPQKNKRDTNVHFPPKEKGKHFQLHHTGETSIPPRRDTLNKTPGSPSSGQEKKTRCPVVKNRGEGLQSVFGEQR